MKVTRKVHASRAEIRCGVGVLCWLAGVLRPSREILINPSVNGIGVRGGGLSGALGVPI